MAYSDETVARLRERLGREPTAKEIKAEHDGPMSDPSSSFEYDVAFSFLAQDEGLATRLNDLLQSRVRTFLYSERQRDVAGKDGEQVFGSVFGEKSRFVALLYREGWGETPWTRVEKIAIQNRTMQEGHDFLLCIPLAQPPMPPNWIPRNRIWIGLDRWGIDGAASVIEARVQELGGEPAEETPTLRAARLGRKREFERLREQFIQGQEGIDKANAAVTHLKTALRKLAEEIATSEKTLPLRVAEVRGEFVLIGPWSGNGSELEAAMDQYIEGFGTMD